MDMSVLFNLRFKLPPRPTRPDDDGDGDDDEDNEDDEDERFGSNRECYHKGMS